jgi:CelD/BcsL family acetyltransferase involved in cellulose biosynthesis
LLNNAVEDLFQDGMWFSLLVEIDGKVAAGMLGAKNQTHICNYVSGMDPNQSEIRPGVLMNLAVIRYACHQGYTHYDLMRGDESYKSRLGAELVPQYTWTATAPRLVPRLRGRMESTKIALKQWYKQYRDADQPAG